MTTDRDEPTSSHRTPHLRPITSSPNSSSTAIVPSRTNPTRGRCPKPAPSPAPSPTSSMRWSRRLRDTRLEPDLEDCSGRPSISSTAPPTASNASSTTTSRRRSTASGAGRLRDPVGRTGAPCRPRASRSSNAATAWSCSATRLPSQFERHTGSSWRPRIGLDGQPPNANSCDDRQPRLPRRQTPRRNRGTASRWTQDRLHRRARLQRSRRDLGLARQGSRQASRHGAAAWRLPRAPSASLPAGPTTAR